MRVLHSYCLATLDENIKSDLILPESLLKDGSKTFTIVDAGPRTKLKPGDKVVLPDAGMAMDVEVDGRKLKLFQDEIVNVVL